MIHNRILTPLARLRAVGAAPRRDQSSSATGAVARDRGGGAAPTSHSR